MSNTKRLTVIGGGAMGEAFVAGLLRAGRPLQATDVTVVEPIASRRDVLARDYGVAVSDDLTRAVGGATAVLLAVKPQQLEVVAGQLAGVLAADQLVLTLMAGVPLETVQRKLGHQVVIRLMPNILCKVGAGMIVWYAAPSVSAEQRAFARALFAAGAAEFMVDDEKYLDMATAVSGSGPAYVLLVLEALIDAGVHLGFPRAQATLLAQQTVLGSALLAREEQRHPAELRNAVTSPGGTTAEGLLVLEQHSVRATIVEAVLAAYTKAQHLR